MKFLVTSAVAHERIPAVCLRVFRHVDPLTCLKNQFRRRWSFFISPQTPSTSLKSKLCRVFRERYAVLGIYLDITGYTKQKKFCEHDVCLKI